MKIQWKTVNLKSPMTGGRSVKVVRVGDGGKWKYHIAEFDYPDAPTEYAAAASAGIDGPLFRLGAHPNIERAMDVCEKDHQAHSTKAKGKR